MADSTQEAGGASRSPILPPTLPTAGGSIRSLGETFTTNPVTGTASMTVPIAASPGRGGFGPALALTYDSGSGNGPFGVGWTLPLPTITRTTERGLPQYRDGSAGEPDSDTFQTGGEDLVPVVDADSDIVEQERDGHRVRAYRPRIESGYQRVERWTPDATGGAGVWWRSISSDNVTTTFGRTKHSRIADPAAPERIFCWLIDAVTDDRGNAVVYEYLTDPPTDRAALPITELNHEFGTNRYLSSVRYGNRSPAIGLDGARRDPALLPASTWMFSLVFDYGDGRLTPLAESPGDPPAADFADDLGYVVLGGPVQPPPIRSDPFSVYRQGFEVRNRLLCRRVLMLHHFPGELGRSDCLVRSTDFRYRESRVLSEVTAVTQAGYVAAPTPTDAGRYLRRATPPLELRYSEAPATLDAVTAPVGAVPAVDSPGLPAGLDSTRSHWVDLDGDGAAGILRETGASWWFSRNLSPLSADGAPRFAAPALLLDRPATSLTETGLRLLDLTGNGRVDVVSLGRSRPGYWQRAASGGWAPFVGFRCLPEIDPDDPQLRFADLDGDGVPDLLLTRDGELWWHQSLGGDGFGPGQRAPAGPAEPRLVFAEPIATVFLADISGDGLTDLVRVSNGDVRYWPNLGYGRFGAPITMAGAPWFDLPDRYSPSRLRLADVDGSGLTDIVYLHPDGPTLYLNEAGNGWSAGRRLTGFPQIADSTDVQLIDLLGDGTACLVWSSQLPADAAAPLRYVRLLPMKPHLLTEVDNNRGGTTAIRYAPSTRFRLADERAGRPWATTLPFPVQVVEQVTTEDLITGNRFVSRYEYHHGYFDGAEREFRGFGCVEQYDTATLATLAADGRPPARNVDAASHVPPALTRSWFQLGGPDDEMDSGELTAGYYREPGGPDFPRLADPPLPSSVFRPAGRIPWALTPPEAREARRALKGCLLRQEIWALDGSMAPGVDAAMPYSVTERSYTVELLQPRSGDRPAVFATAPLEQLDVHYERAVVDVGGQLRADPRIGHTVTLEMDCFGAVLRTAAMTYRRRDVPGILPEQLVSSVLLRVHRVAHRLAGDVHRLGLPVESRTFEVVAAPDPALDSGRVVPYSVEQLTDLASTLFPPSSPEPPPDALWPLHRWDWRTDPDRPGTPRLRLTAHDRTRYRDDHLTGPLPLGSTGDLALTHSTSSLSLTPELVAEVFRDGAVPLLPDSAVLTSTDPGGGGYTADDGGWWVPSGTTFFSADADPAAPAATAAAELDSARAHFFTVVKAVDAFGASTLAEHDPHDLLVRATTDAADNVWSADHDYRVLEPRTVTDPNGNRTAGAYDALGYLTATAVLGKADVAPLDSLVGVDPDPPLTVLQAFAADPAASAGSLLGAATSRTVYDLHRYRRCGQPALIASLGRTRRGTPAPPGDVLDHVQIQLSFADGMGGEVQKKLRAEPGAAALRAAALPGPTGDVIPGTLLRDADGSPRLGPVNARWIGTGRTVLNNKAKPVRQYEPFFSSTPLFETEEDLVNTGQSTVFCYDPLARVVATLGADAGYGKVVFDAWRQQSFDPGDTVLDDPRTDPDTSAVVAGHFAGRPPGWLTWHARRVSGALGTAEKGAAVKAAAHAHTPGSVLVDPAGRGVHSTVHNRVNRGAGPVDELLTTTIVLDGAGHVRAVVDSRGAVVMRFDCDARGARLVQSGAESGRQWVLPNVTGSPILAWNGRGQRLRTEYDVLRRPIRHSVGAGTLGAPEALVGRTVYGDDPAVGLPLATVRSLNLLTHVYQQFDGAGVITNVAVNPDTGGEESFDGQGNRLRSTRRFTVDHRAVPDWSAAPALGEELVTAAAFDALNRPVAVTAPDGSTVLTSYNEADLLETLSVRFAGAAADTPFVTGIDYDAKGRRATVEYGNSAVGTQQFDPATGRLTRLRITRPTPPGGEPLSGLFVGPADVQDLRYTYDAAGNLVAAADAALATVFHDNRQVGPGVDFTYDAAYQLVHAAGREHIGQCAHDPAPPPGQRRDVPFVGARLPHPFDVQALRPYTERYHYDGAGNLLRLIHDAGVGSWTRAYTYAEPSLLEPGRAGNRLSRTTVGATVENYGYLEPAGDGQGLLTSLNGLALHWDSAGRLQSVDLGGGRTVHYCYDGAGQRARTVVEQNGVPQSERIYGGVFERYREFAPGPVGGVRLERTTLHVTAGGTRVALAETLRVSGGVAFPNPRPSLRYQFGDHLGSSSVELDASGRLISHETYHPFGTTAFQAGPAAAETSLKRYRFTGRERDEETGFSFHRARWYLPWLGRWASSDPIGVDDGVNLYAYVHNRPTTATDPAGTGGWQEVQTEEAGARYFQHQEKGLAIRKDKAGQELWKEVDTNVYRGVLTMMTPETYTHAGPKTIERDIKNLPPSTFQDKYGATSMQYDELAKALVAPPEPIVIPQDKTLTMGEGGQLGPADEMGDMELAYRLQHIGTPTVTGSLYGVVAVALGADAKEASRMMAIGDQLDGMVFAAAAVGAGLGAKGNNEPPAGKPPAAAPPPPANGAGGWSNGRRHMPIVNPHFAHNDPDTIFLDFAAKTGQKLRADPALTNRYLRPSESRLASYGPWAQRIVFGNAVERAMAHGSAPTGLLVHTGDIRPAPLGGPDLVGLPGSPLAGRPIQVTSYRGWETHVENAPPDTIWAVYPP